MDLTFVFLGCCVARYYTKRWMVVPLSIKFNDNDFD